MRICIDTNVLIDILKDEHRRFQDMLYAALSAREKLVVPTVVFAELMPQFKGDTTQVHLFLKDHKIDIEALDLSSAALAGERWMGYLNRKTKAKCPKCKSRLDFKEHFLSDFYIGGFALKKCGAILTRDRGIYCKYFPELEGHENCLKSKAHAS